MKKQHMSIPESEKNFWEYTDKNFLLQSLVIGIGGEHAEL